MHVSPVDVVAFDHWQWRPEWQCDRPCWYWYLTLDAAPLASAAQQVTAYLDAVPWLDVVPPRWWHLTVCDVGFDDELLPDQVHDVAEAVARRLPVADALEIALGPVVAFRSAIAALARPLGRLRRLQAEVRDATQEALGPECVLVHRHEFWPHVSFGYMNRDVSSSELEAVMAGLTDPSVTVRVDRLTLVSVTRRDRHYQWVPRTEIGFAERCR